MDEPNIVNLLASATEIVCPLGYRPPAPGIIVQMGQKPVML